MSNNSNLERYGALTQDNCAVLLIDHCLCFMQTVESASKTEITNNVVALAKTALLYKIPLLVTDGRSNSIGGGLIPQLKEAIGNTEIMYRSNGDMDSFNDATVNAAVKATGKKKLVIAGICTDVCLLMSTLHALKEGYEVYVAADASGGITLASSKYALKRMTQAGATLISWVTFISELQVAWGGDRAQYTQGLDKIVSEHCNQWSNMNDYYIVSRQQGINSTKTI